MVGNFDHPSYMYVLADCLSASIVAFSVAIQRSIEVQANENHVPLISSNVIYTVVDRVQARAVDLLPPIIENKVTGEANVLQLFDIHLKGKKTMKVAGCRVINGVMNKAKPVRVVRDHKTIHEGLSQLFILSDNANSITIPRPSRYHAAFAKRDH
jgi:translation initiation factor IF-2